MPFKDHFSTQAKDYSRYRPRYPRELFQYLASLVPEHNLAWDCATGNGQAALSLAPFFDKVIATDASEKQISQARAHEKVIYQVAPAEKTAIASSSVDLITVAQALHWFDFEEFYAEVRRVAKPEGLLAVWCYAFFEGEERVNSLVMDFYSNVVGPYWPPDRKRVEETYETIPFPFERLVTPEFFIEDAWDLNEIMGYLRTWSATQRFIEKNQQDPLIDFETQMKKIWGPSDKRKAIRWKIHLKVGRISSPSTPFP